MRVFFLLFFLGFGNLFADSILNLRENSVFVREGYDPSWNTSSEELENSSEWLKVTQGIGKSHSLSARYLQIPIRFPRHFLSLDDSPEESFSYVFHFTPTKKSLEEKNSFGIYFSSIGIRWQVYLNGKLVHDKLQDNGNNGKFQFLLPVTGTDLREGENSILVRIHGPRSSHLTGFYQSDSILFGAYDDFVHRKEDLVMIFLCIIYLIIFLFYLILWLNKPSQVYYALYALFSGVLSIYIASISHVMAYFILDSYINYKIQAITFFTLPVLGILFFRNLFNQKLSPLDIILIPLLFCVSLGSLVFSISWVYDAIQTYKFTLPILGGYVQFFIVGTAFREDYRTEYLPITNPGDWKERWTAYRRAIVGTVSGNLFASLLIFNVLMVFDVIDGLFFLKLLFLSKYGFLIFVLAIAFSLSNRYLRISEKNLELNQELGLKLRELESSSQKTKFLIDGTNDLLFVLGQDFAIRSMNQAARKYFGVRPESLIGKNFMELLYTTPKDHQIVNQLVQENIRTLDSPGKQIRFRARIRTSRMQEPLEFTFRLEAVESEEHLEFIGKATSSLDENLTGYIVEESQVYLIDNYILVADEMSHRLVRVLSKKMPDYRVNAIQTGLREILVNSIEHGNLNISFEDKSQHLSKGDYLEFVSTRQKDPVYSKRKVQIVYTLTQNGVSYHITDEGDGFDYQELMMKAFANQALGREHGRGIMLAENIFDKVEYLGKGNSVFLQLDF